MQFSPWIIRITKSSLCQQRLSHFASNLVTGNLNREGEYRENTKVFTSAPKTYCWFKWNNTKAIQATRPKYSSSQNWQPNPVSVYQQRQGSRRTNYGFYHLLVAHSATQYMSLSVCLCVCVCDAYLLRHKPTNRSKRSVRKTIRTQGMSTWHFYSSLILFWINTLYLLMPTFEHRSRTLRRGITLSLKVNSPTERITRITHTKKTFSLSFKDRTGCRSTQMT